MIRKIIFLLILLIPFSLFAQEPAYQRIISLSPPLTENLYILGAQDKLIGVTSYCIHPEEAKTKEIVGTLLEPNIEKIYGLKPDLIIATNQGLSAKAIAKIRSLGLNLKIIDYEGNFKTLCDSFLELGKIVGEEERAQAIIAETTRCLEDNLALIKGFSQPTVFWEYGEAPLITAAADTFADDIIYYSGGANIFHDLRSRYPQISREEVVKRDPDFIFIISMGEKSEKEKLRWLEFKNLKAVKNERVFIIDAHKACSPTPHGFIEVVQEITVLLHGLL